MSEQLINRNPDLKRLRDEGYDVAIRANHLLVRDVPYVAGPGRVERGTLVSALKLAGDLTDTPDTHVAMFAGEYPCDQAGEPLNNIKSSGPRELGGDLVVDHWFSSKPVSGGYVDYYDKMTAYIAIFEGYAQALEPGITARTFPVIEPEQDESVFYYLDTASSRAGIGGVTDRLTMNHVAIVGVGGTGSYVLDFLAKTPVREIHLYDGDILYSHNAFRAPGAPSLEELRAKPTKVAYLTAQYSRMRRGIIPHEYFLDESNAHELAPADFVFICIDSGEAKRPIVEKLEELGKTFIDVGMGIDLDRDALGGIVRATTSIPTNRHSLRNRVSLADATTDDDYRQNIQIADLNALNAALAVIKWKKLCGFYHDTEHHLNAMYTIDADQLLSEDNDAPEHG
jgi:hypothetical protein